MQVSYHTKSAQIFLRAEYNLPEEHVNYQAFSKKKKSQDMRNLAQGLSYRIQCDPWAHDNGVLVMAAQL